ncbi:histidine kinase [Chitinophaga sp. 212800010-3]|uniref:sensor histidine kinase n=1 Tax=unclassified Chitinophaga TaxID=2619133 RepID=UPI002DF3106E|nr:His-kinase domain-containing protein [Chitinophaga sp. 212800010-3]
MKQYYIAHSRLLTHILFWVGYLLVYTGVHSDGEDGMLHYFEIEVAGLPGAMLVAYINMYMLFPRFFVKEKYLQYIASAVLLLFVASLMNRMLSEWVMEPLLMPDTTHVDPIFVWYMLLKGMLWFLSPVLLLTLVICILRNWFIQQQLQQELTKEKLGAELNYLKGQVHPHFLFNTLNNLYALTLKASPSAPVVVLKLSELMSYMLYDARSSSISLEKEITHIRNYIQLEQLRYGERLEVSLNISGDVMHQQVPPLLLIPFIENAFKHGVSNETDEVWVTIDIKVKNGWLGVKVENSFSGHQPRLEEGRSGIGWNNVSRRLALLYPGSHELMRREEPDRYIVDLKLKLDGAPVLINTLHQHE